MRIRSFVLSAVALAAMCSSSFAICYEDVQDVPDIVNVITGKTVVQASGGPQDGWDGVAVKCTLLSGVASIAPSRDANGICGSARSIVGQGPASLKKLPDTTETIVTPDIDIYRIGVWIPRPGPDLWVGTGWKPGHCPF